MKRFTLNHAAALAVTLSSAFIVGCAYPDKPVQAPTQSGGYPVSPVAVSPAAYPSNTASGQPIKPPLPVASAGKLTQLTGVYAGQAVCAQSLIQMRNDWTLEYLDGGVKKCVYVSQGLPPGIVPAPSKTSIGLPVSIEGELWLSGAGQTYFLMRPKS